MFKSSTELRGIWIRHIHNRLLSGKRVRSKWKWKVFGTEENKMPSAHIKFVIGKYFVIILSPHQVGWLQHQYHQC